MQSQWESFIHLVEFISKLMENILAEVQIFSFTRHLTRAFSRSGTSAYRGFRIFDLKIGFGSKVQLRSPINDVISDGIT